MPTTLAHYCGMKKELSGIVDLMQGLPCVKCIISELSLGPPRTDPHHDRRLYTKVYEQRRAGNITARDELQIPQPIDLIGRLDPRWLLRRKEFSPLGRCRDGEIGNTLLAFGRAASLVASPNSIGVYLDDLLVARTIHVARIEAGKKNTKVPIFRVPTL